MLEFVLVAALVWPRECVVIGELYRTAAEMRDAGHELQKALSMTADKRIRRTLIHVYSRPDMTAEQWQWFAVGACVGESHNGVKTNYRRGI